ncbi:pimeloyl-ACP methyl ester carboxylesterase [Asanoa ferruginea]|uniref:Pimeloyl-ACP methyl ester carboxylesterase n=1 Tax=Asanoa ferruginea TaxID=53367 RepID=A0A3D9ZCA2_9ACTN|nr:alpha/beta hydrolase [Asanoa ferruginea]REF94559.1 pimeloyl-ACP methyl ester carboxylesterase [Asanoa ferruginea]GIF51555.1 alpha/beta hydrolase [Asanoa ferruginea]
MKRILVALRRRLPLLIAIFALASLAVPSAVAAARPMSTEDAYPVKPTIVLVHGAWADGSSWNGVTERLHEAGYLVRVPPNPLRSLAGDTETIGDFLSTISGPIVLVGHSYGGAVITNAATGNPNVRALVYVDAFVPDEGEKVAPLVGDESVLSGDPALVFDFVPYPGSAQGDADLYVKESVFVNGFATGLPAEAARVLWASQRPLAASASDQPSGPPAWKTIRSWYVLGTQDQVIPPDRQHAMAERAGSAITKVDAGHLSLITNPDEVTSVIVNAVEHS